MNLKKSIILLVLLFAGKVYSQEIMYITFLQDSAAVGESVDLVITMESNPEQGITDFQLSDLNEMMFFPPVQAQDDSVKTEKADLSILNLGLWEDLNKDGKLSGAELKWQEVKDGAKTLYQNRLQVAFFDVGIYAFNGFNFVFNGKSYNTNRALMKVTFKEYDLEVVDSTGLAPIKNIEKEPLKLQDFLPYLLYILLPLLLIYLGYRYYKKKKNQETVVVEEVVIIPPDVKALTDLKELRAKELWQKGEIKQYQSELSHVIREYLEGRYDIHALESTTSQIINSIKDKSFTNEDQEKLKRILQISDLVKFAKAKPEVNIHEEFMNDAVNFIQRTKKIERLENQEEE